MNNHLWKWSRTCVALLTPRGFAGRVSPSLAVAALLLSSAAVVRAAEVGTVTGRVLDESSGKYLEGADVGVQGSDIHVLTDRDGAYTLSGVPAGAQVLNVEYVGMSPVKVNINVTSGTATQVGVTRLSADVVSLGEFKVTGMREGMAQAVSLQKVSLQAKLVAAADQFGPVSEGNVGEYLKYMPGVTIDYNVNDARGVSLRGLSTAFTIVTVDGTPMAGASSTDDTRRFEFEQIAMNNVETTELFKTMTPDISAGATGGYVNFVTKSAFDHEQTQRFNYDVSFSAPSTNVHFSKQGGVWGASKEYTIRPNVEANFSRKLTEKIGFNINYRLSEKYDDSPRTEFTWNTGTALPNVMTNPRLQQYNIRSEEKLTHREALAGKLDFRLSDRTQLSVAGQWNWYDLNFTQRGPGFVLGANGVANGETYTSGSGSSIQNGVLYREKYGTTWHFNSTLKHEFENGSKLLVTPYWSRADGQYRDTSKGFISTVPTMSPGAATYSTFTIANPNDLGTLPTITINRAGGATVPIDFLRDLGNYTLSNTTGTNFQSRPWTAIDTKTGGRADYSIDMDLRVPVTFMAGVAFDSVRRMIDRPDYRYNIPATTGAALEALGDPLYTRDVALGFGSIEAINPYKAYEAFKDRPVILSALDHRNIEEENSAGYIRADVNVTKDLVLVGGVRYEKRTIEAKARTGSPARARETLADLDFDQYYPSLQLKYTPRRNIALRGGVSRTVGIPDYGELLPTFVTPTTSGGSDGTISVPSDGLKPYMSTNYDVNVDYYLRNSGVIGVSVFRKDISDYIISRPMSAQERTDYLTDYGLNPSDFGSTGGMVRENGAKSRLQGVEVSFAQNLSMLPGALKGLSVQANFTYTDVDAFDADRFRAIDTLYSQLRAVSPKTANLIVGYRIGKFNTTIATNWVSESLYGGFVNTSYFTGTANIVDTTRDTRLALYKDEKLTTDIKLEYSFNERFSAYFLVRNVFNSAREEYARGYLPENQSVVLPYRYYEFGEPHLTIGFRGTF